jgi:glycosyltransferase involved in cell wall biosynthesis
VDVKIAACVRTLNEEENILRFIKSYISWVDLILVADGGSEDKTVEIAKSMPLVEVRPFHEWIECGKGVFRNPQNRHINFLMDWAQEEGADWICFDDCDCAPNWMLQKSARQIMEATDKLAIMVYRMYLYGDDQWFPKLNEPGQSIWAWRSGVCRALEDTTDTEECGVRIPYPPPAKSLFLDFPLALLHRGWPNEEVVHRKMNFYRTTRGIDMQHPLEFGGPPENLPAWASEEHHG